MHEKTQGAHRARIVAEPRIDDMEYYGRQDHCQSRKDD
jgi:hypothetical protein